MSLSLKDLLWEKRIRKYRGSADDPESQLLGFVAFCEEQLWIQHPEGRRLFVMREAQIETARSYILEPQILILKARQIGFTTVSMAFVLWRALFFRDFSAINISRKEDDAVAALWMAIFAYEQMDEELRARLPLRTDRGKRRMTFDNGSYIESHPSADNPARGRTVTLIILDEWAFMPNAEEAWASVKPTFDIGGRVIALSTASGYGNMFHSMWVKASAGDNKFHPIFYPWWAVPERDEAWYEAQKLEFAEWQLHQEYPSDPEEAFIKSGNPVFSVDVIRGMRTRNVQPTRLVDSLGTADGWRAVSLTSGGPLFVYHQPKPLTSYVIGADTAAGLSYGDYSSAHVIDVSTGDVAAVFHAHIEPDLFGIELCRMGAFFNMALIGTEVNNHGLSVIKAQQRAGYPRIYRRHRLDSRLEERQESLGWYTSHASKPKMIDDLGMELRNGGVTVEDRGTQQELITYVRLEDGKMAGSPYDDRVISLAIANQMRAHAAPVGRPQDPAKVPGTFAHAMEEMLERDRRMAHGNAIGTHNVRRAS